VSVPVVAFATLWATGCASHLVSVLTPVSEAPPAEHAALSVVVEATAVHLPLPVSGANVAYSDVDRALSRSIGEATTEVAKKIAGAGRSDQLTVELIEAHAEYSVGRLVVSLTTRDTLRARTGNTYIAQTYARGSASGIVSPERGGTVVLRVTDAIGSQLSGFLLGLDLH
jgi:hypothetical protein